MIDDTAFKPRDPNAPDKTIVEFFRQAVEIPFKSAEKGMPVYEDREFARMISPGNSKSIPVEVVTEEHKKRWPREYQAFAANLAAPVIGTPLAEWSALSPATVLNLTSVHVRTVEQLADLSDADLQHIGIGGRELREKAKAFVGQHTSKESALESALADALKRLAALENKPRRAKKVAAEPDAGEHDTDEDDDDTPDEDGDN
jgi:hypothetical protein